MKKALGILLTIIGLIVAFYLLVIVTAWTQETRYEKSIVTIEEVEAKLKGIAELSSYSGEYTVTYGKD